MSFLAVLSMAVSIATLIFLTSSSFSITTWMGCREVEGGGRMEGEREKEGGREGVREGERERKREGRDKGTKRRMEVHRAKSILQTALTNCRYIESHVHVCMYLGF